MRCVNLRNIQIILKNGNDSEKRVKEILQKLLDKYSQPLAKHIVTDKINIQSMAISHSHPVLTLNTRTFDEDQILATFLHEQIHWYLDCRKEPTERIIVKLKKKYPIVPVGQPEGAKTKNSTYLHIIVNFLEYKVLIEILGQKKAEKILIDKDYYKWIYRKVISDIEELKVFFDKIY